VANHPGYLSGPAAERSGANHFTQKAGISEAMHEN
jgi:hypothetical protein